MALRYSSLFFKDDVPSHLHGNLLYRSKLSTMSETGVNLKGITTATVPSLGIFALLEIFPAGLLTRSPPTHVERNIS